MLLEPFTAKFDYYHNIAIIGGMKKLARAKQIEIRSLKEPVLSSHPIAMSSSKYICTWDPDCLKETMRWLKTDPPVAQSKRFAYLHATLTTGYFTKGPEESTPRIPGLRGERKVELCGHSEVDVALYVGIDGFELRILVFGPVDIHDAENIAHHRLNRWDIDES